MFACAYATAAKFTRCAVASILHPDGKCESTLGAYVVVNDEGWILTAAHIVDLVQQLEQRKRQFSVYRQAVLAIEQDKGLLPDQRRKKVRNLGGPPKGAVEDYSFWWGYNGWTLKLSHVIKEADLALCQLDGFDPSQIGAYPSFRNPTKGTPPGTSLCRLGFPFMEIKPTYANGAFQLNTQFTFFPNEGMLTRVVVIKDDPDDFVGFIETSSAGLRGQSGGPIFDTHGTVWGIQSHTGHLSLGFSPPVPGGQAGQVEHQFLNVGRGAHPATIVGLMTNFNVKHTIST